jgi:dimethylamine monooxygenase subunit A
VNFTPYDGSTKPFTIGLKPLDPADWIDIDDEFDLYLTEKRRLYAAETQNVLVAEAGTEDAQYEVLDLVTQHLTSLPKRESGPHIFTARQDSGFVNQPWAALAAAGLMVQDDLVLMRNSPQGWRLVAASLCFPAAWSLREKFGKPLGEVHGPVPGFHTGTRNAALIGRMFDNLSTLVMRWNWTLFGETPLYHPVAEGGIKRRFGDGTIAENVTIRMERQTLRKLPRSRDILFTIRTYREPLAALENRPEGPQLALAIADQVAAYTEDELRYKGLGPERPRILARLRQIIEGDRP